MIRRPALAVALLLAAPGPLSPPARAEDPTPPRTRTRTYDFDAPPVAGDEAPPLRAPAPLTLGAPAPGAVGARGPAAPDDLPATLARLQRLRGELAALLAAPPGPGTAAARLALGRRLEATARARWTLQQGAWEAAAACHADGRCLEDPGEPAALDLSDAVAAFARCAEGPPKAPEAAAALLALATAREQPGAAHDRPAALAERLRFARTYPGHPMAAENLLAISDAYFDEGQLKAALTGYAQVVTLGGPGGPLAAYAYYKSGWAHLNLRAPAPAVASFTAARAAARGPSRDALVRQVDMDLTLAFAGLEAGWREAARFFAQHADAAAARRALTRMATVYEDSGRAALAVEVLDHLLVTTTEPGERAALQTQRRRARALLER